MAMPRSRSRRAIDPAWEMPGDLREYAAARDLDADREWDRFRDYHAAHGSLMADWHAAWRYWCGRAHDWRKRAAKRKEGKPGTPIEAAVAAAIEAPADDAYGAETWAGTVHDRVSSTIDGAPAWCLNGWGLAITARDVCAAVGWPPTWRGDLDMVAVWLREGHDPEDVVRAVSAAMRRRKALFKLVELRPRVAGILGGGK